MRALSYFLAPFKNVPGHPENGDCADANNNRYSDVLHDLGDNPADKHMNGVSQDHQRCCSANDIHDDCTHDAMLWEIRAAVNPESGR